MDSNFKKDKLKTISAKITTEARADLDERAKKAGMIMSDYLRLIIAQVGVEGDKDNVTDLSPKQDMKMVPDNGTCCQNQLIVNQLQEIAEKQDVILKNITDENSKMFYSIMFGVVILIIGCTCFISDH
ncbi:hypothetical protein [Ferruginibacter sp. SUN106]|uniref:hypothetical protein n=1 Tax=Ferruginibacter sp. SUN106 TaxID=2978348 RepID=UPI003D35F97B